MKVSPAMRCRRAFTLVEILIVVVLIGILASIVVPQFSKAVQDSSETATFDQLTRVRRAVAYYQATNNGNWPTVSAGSGTWGPLIPLYLREVPRNFWVPEAASRVIRIDTQADTSYQNTAGWIYDPDTGNVWAGGYDQYDNPLPR